MNILPSGWSIATIDNLVADKSAITDGPFGSNLKTSHYTDSGPRVIRLQNIGDGSFIDEEAHISEEHYERLRKHAVEEGDLIIASLGTELPRSCLVPRELGPAIVKADCIRVRIDRSVADERYVNYLLNSSHIRHQSAEIVHGVGRPRLGLTGIRQLKLPIAPLHEQRRIVDAIEEQFSRLDSADATLLRVLGLLAHLRGSAVLAALQGDWAWVTLGDVSEAQQYGSSAKASGDTDASVPMLRMGNIQDGEITFDGLKYLPASHPDVTKYELQPGDLLFNRTNSPELVGKSAVYREGSPRAIFASYLIRVKLTARCIPEWAALVINSPIGRRYIAQVRTQQVGQANVNGTKLKALPLPLPRIAEQRQLLARTQSLLSMASAMEQELRTARLRSARLRSALLAEAFAGRLVESDSQRECSAGEATASSRTHEV